MSVSLFNLSITSLTESELTENCASYIQQQKPHFLVSLNTEIIMRAEKDKDFKNILQAADIIFADGIGILWAAGVKNFWQGLFRGLFGFFYRPIYKCPIKTQTRGREFALKLAKLASLKGYSIYLLGADPGIAQKAANELIRLHSNLNINAESGPQKWVLNSPEDIDICSQIKNKKPDILLCAFGVPKDEQFIFHHKQELNVPVMLGVGGTFDYITGLQKLPPKWIANSGFEWLWRLVHEPRRYRRQFVLPKFIWHVLTHKSQSKKQICNITKKTP